MSTKILVPFCLLITVLLITGLAQAQQTKVARIGFLSSLSPSAVADRIEAFRQGLRELGYVEGKHIVIERRYAEGKTERLPDLAAELVRLKVDVIVTGGPAVNRFAKEATAKIPIVLPFDNDPVGNGFAASLARPGGNLTGFSTQFPEITGKQLELLKEIIPKLSRIAVLGNSTIPGNAQALKETGLAAGMIGVKFQYLDIQNPEDIETAFRANPCATEPGRYFSCKTIRTTGDEKPASGDILELGICGGRRSYGLQREHY
jgi:putative ABC transport system substrate-binding protein